MLYFYSTCLYWGCVAVCIPDLVLQKLVHAAVVPDVPQEHLSCLDANFICINTWGMTDKKSNKTTQLWLKFNFQIYRHLLWLLIFHYFLWENNFSFCCNWRQKWWSTTWNKWQQLQLNCKKVLTFLSKRWTGKNTAGRGLCDDSGWRREHNHNPWA